MPDSSDPLDVDEPRESLSLFTLIIEARDRLDDVLVALGEAKGPARVRAMIGRFVKLLREAAGLPCG